MAITSNDSKRVNISHDAIVSIICSIHCLFLKIGIWAHDSDQHWLSLTSIDSIEQFSFQGNKVLTPSSLHIPLDKSCVWARNWRHLTWTSWTQSHLKLKVSTFCVFDLVHDHQNHEELCGGETWSLEPTKNMFSLADCSLDGRATLDHSLAVSLQWDHNRSRWYPR